MGKSQQGTAVVSIAARFSVHSPTGLSGIGLPIVPCSPWHQAAILFLSCSAKSLQCAMTVQRDHGSVLPVSGELTQRL